MNKLIPGSSGINQATIDTYRAALTTGEQQVSTAANSFADTLAAVTTAKSSVAVAKNELSLAQSGSTPEALQIQQAKVAQAEASVMNTSSILSKSTIVSPIEGVVSQVVPKVGQITSAGQIAFSVISNNSYQIELQIPEADIAKVSIGNLAKITLDAYGSEVVFTGKVVLIDPAETIVEGVPTYKVTLQFDTTDPRVKSGMTANINLVTNSKTNVIVLPTRAIIDRGSEKFVMMQTPSGQYAEYKVKTGLKGSNGMTEILEGLSVGQTVGTFVK